MTKRYAFVVFDDGTRIERCTSDSFAPEGFHIANLLEAAELTGHKVLNSGIEEKEEDEFNYFLEDFDEFLDDEDEIF